MTPATTSSAIADHGITPTGTGVVWESMHLFKVSGGVVVEHSAVRDDGLLQQPT